MQAFKRLGQSFARHCRSLCEGLSYAVGLACAVGCHVADAQTTNAQTTNAISPERARVLVRMVRQDCGSCHGMRLTGGLGPALTPAALQHVPVNSLAATIYHGRAGTPMPPWRAMINMQEADWIAQQLLAGFPPEETHKP